MPGAHPFGGSPVTSPHTLGEEPVPTDKQRAAIREAVAKRDRVIASRKHDERAQEQFRKANQAIQAVIKEVEDKR